MKNFPERIFYFQNQLLLKHWQEMNGFKHQVTGEYYAQLTPLFDSLMECYLSLYKDVTVSESAYILINHIDMSGTFYIEIKKFVDDFRKFTIHPSLVKILDDISTLIEQYNYLLIKE